MIPLQPTRWVATGLVVFGGLAGWSGCASMGSSTEAGFMYKNLPVASGSAVAGDGHSVTLRGEPKALAGRGINVGDPLRDAELAQLPDLDAAFRAARALLAAG